MFKAVIIYKQFNLLFMFAVFLNKTIKRILPSPAYLYAFARNLGDKGSF